MPIRSAAAELDVGGRRDPVVRGACTSGRQVFGDRGTQLANFVGFSSGL